MSKFSALSLAPSIASALLALGLATGAGAAGLPPISPDALRPAREDGEFLPALRGHWMLSGYGHLYTIKRRKVDVYNQAGGLCWLDPIGSAQPDAFFGWYGRSRLRNDTVFAPGRDDLQFHIDPLPQIPGACTRAIDRTRPVYTFDAIANSMIEYFPFAADRGVDFVQRKAQLRPRAIAARNDAELLPVVEELMAGLDDPHTGVNAYVDGTKHTIGQLPGKATAALLVEKFAEQTEVTDFDAWFAQWLAHQGDSVLALLEPGTARQELGNAVTWGKLPGNVGYLGIGAMLFDEDLSEDDNRELLRLVLDDALEQLADTRAIVVDITFNTGGSALVASDIAARFADRKRLAYTRHAPGSLRAAPHPFYTKPGGALRYAKPVVLLTSDMTVSAAEHLALYLRVLPQVTHVGQATQGAVSGGIARGLPNGWEFGYAIHETRDAHGRSYEVAGIPPTIAFDVFTSNDFENGRANAVRRAAEIAATR